jgi:hypothetical protein
MPPNQTAGGAESAAPAFNTMVASGERERPGYYEPCILGVSP